MSQIDRDIDLLVDGELPEERRRKLLSELDASTGDWRRLAVAFVEAQAMHEALGGLGDVKQQPQPPAAATHVDQRLAGPSYMTFCAAVAASFLVALAVGLSIRGEQNSVAKQPAVLKRPATQVPKDDTPMPIPTQPSPAMLASDEGDQTRYGEATLLVSDADGSSRRVRLPVVFAQDDQPLRQLSRQPSIPPHVQHALERMGYRVEQQRSVVRRELDDGREMLVPVDQVNVNYVGAPTYQ